MINIKQNFEDIYFDNFGFPMIICNSHPNNVYEFINLNNQNPNKLACAQCIIKDMLNPQFLISIKDLFSKNPSNIIQNWPPLQDLNIYQQLISQNLQESWKIQSIEQINKYFDKLKADIFKTIDEQQKKILVHINSIEENRQRVINVYNEISSKDEIKNEFLKNKNNQQQLEKNLKQLITMKQTQERENRQNINNAYDTFTKSEKQFEFEYIQNVFKQVLIDLKQIEVLNLFLTKEQQLSQKISYKKKNQDEEIVQNLKIIQKNEVNEEKNDRNEIDLLESLQILKSNYGQPDLISLKKIENNYFLIEKSRGSWSQVIIEQELIGEKKYQIQIDLKENKNDQIVFGLLPLSQKDQAGWNSKLSLYLSEGGDGIDLIESGKHISKLGKDNIKQISFQICLKEKILRCLSVVNNIKNINSLNNWNKIQPNQQYYFYIALFGQKSIEISQFKIIKQFDKW